MIPVTFQFPLNVPSSVPCPVYLSFLFLASSPSLPCHIEVCRLCGFTRGESGMVGGKKRWQVSWFWTCGCNTLVNCFYCFMVGKLSGNVLHRSEKKAWSYLTAQLVKHASLGLWDMSLLDG